MGSFADDCRAFAARVRAFREGNHPFGNDFLTQLADDCDEIADTIDVQVVGPTDSERFEWLAARKDMRLHGNDTNGWSIKDCRDGLVSVVRNAPTMRAALDQAMAKLP